MGPSRASRKNKNKSISSSSSRSNTVEAEQRALHKRCVASTCRIFDGWHWLMMINNVAFLLLFIRQRPGQQSAPAPTVIPCPIHPSAVSATFSCLNTLAPSRPASPPPVSFIVGQLMCSISCNISRLASALSSRVLCCLLCIHVDAWMHCKLINLTPCRSATPPLSLAGINKHS